MFSTVSLLTLLALSITITGSPVEVRNGRITLPMTRRLKFSNSSNLVQRDEARVAAFRDYSTHSQRAHIPSANDRLSYTVSVGIGSPPTTYHLVVDTGSAVTWVGADTEYVETGTSFSLGQRVGEAYPFAAFTGILFTDTVSLSNELTVARMPIGVAYAHLGIMNDGILGIGPRGLTIRTLEDNPRDTYPTITELLHTRNIISEPLVAIFFKPSTGTDDDGQLSFGEVDPAYINSIVYTGVTTTPPASNYWGIDQSITYGTTDILLSTAGIIDSGFTFISIASDAYQRYQAATGGTFDAAANLLAITPVQYRDLQELKFHIDGQTYGLTRDGQIWPRSLNSAINGANKAIYLVIKDIGTPTGQGLNFLNGFVFLQRFYTVFDTRNRRIGFARTPFTGATTNYNY
ncbi:aspartic proteinase [Suillus spraguei]|nr:aspartic proteinase [Suillus spraguei]